MAAKFEVVSKYKDSNITIPVRKTANSAGYDLEVVEDIYIYPYSRQKSYLTAAADSMGSHTLEELAALTKETKIKPTLVSTGLKCRLDPDTYLELSVRSSTPLKYWLILANGVGRLLF